MKSLHEGRLSADAIVALIHDSTKVSKTTIRKILQGLQDLEKVYLKTPSDKPVSRG